jgi:predicted peptidase
MLLPSLILFALLGQTALAIDVKLSTGDLHFSDGQGHSMPYRLYLPAGFDPSVSYPLIMDLHGSGLSGTDNVMPSAYDADNLFNATQGNLGAQYKSFLLLPQTISDWGWQDYGPQYPQYVGQKLAMGILNEVLSSYNVDTRRLYLTGLSMGGFGTFNAIAHYPHTFAAAIPLSGGGDPSDAAIIKDIPIWAYHGIADTGVPVSCTDEMYDAIEAAGGHMEYSRVEGIGHWGWETFYDGSTYTNSKGQTLYQWMFTQSLPVPEPSTIGMTLGGLGFGLVLLLRRRLGAKYTTRPLGR